MARKVDFQGSVHEFPDSATDDQIRTALTSQSQPKPVQPEGVMGHVENFAKNFWGELVNSGQGMVDAGKAVFNTAGHLIGQREGEPGVGDALSNIGSAQDAVRLKAHDALKRGDYTEAARHALSYLIPVAGPGIDARGDQAQAGDISGALGGAASIGLQLAGPEALPKGASVRVGPKITNPNPTEAAALDYLQSKDVPVSAGARTGNAYVKGVQKLADSTPLGAVVAQRAEKATSAGLRSEADSLAGRANSVPVVPEQAGAGVRSALTKKAAARGADADQAYGDFRQIEQSKPMPVDVTGIKGQLKPIFEDMQKWMEPAKRNASAGFQAVKSIMEGPDAIPASQAEIGLGGLKQLAREGAGRNAGLGKLIVPKLQSAIDGAVAADPAAAHALKAGRSATAAQHGTQAVLDDLRAEPVQTFGQMTYAKDSGIDLLRKVQQESPAELPKVGRAYLEDLFGKATSQGGFGGADGLYSKWQNLGPETKKLLFNQSLVGDLDKFFLGAKKLAENPNPSGSGTLASIGAGGMLIITHPATGVPLAIGAGALSKMLHSEIGVRALTEGMKLPLKAPAAAIRAGQILKMAGKDVTELPKAASDQTQQSDLLAAAQGRQ